MIDLLADASVAWRRCLKDRLPSGFPLLGLVQNLNPSCAAYRASSEPASLARFETGEDQELCLEQQDITMDMTLPL